MNSKIATLFMVVWLFSALTSIITLPDYERYHGRIERTEKLLRTHCSDWSLVKDADYVPAPEFIVRKCFRKDR